MKGATPDRSAAWEEFLPLLESLIEESDQEGTVVVVEGERDYRSLRRLGVGGSIVRLHRGQSMSELAHDLGRRRRRVILLTDWDSEGGVLARRLKELLEAGDARVDLEYRRRFARALRGEVVHVEGLAGWARRTAEGQGAPLEEWLRGVGPTGRSRE
jgi:5S rRNA maturation endonuclease (ribonuclease M5)